MSQKRYPSDLSDAQWAAVEPFVGRPDPRGNPGKYPRRRILEGLLYVLNEGCRWRSLPHDFPPWESVYDHFRRWKERGVWAELAEALARADRITKGREPAPSVALIDSQSVKSTGAGQEHGFHGGKRIKGRSRHVVTDTGGRILAVRVTSAKKADSPQAGPTLAQAKERFEALEASVGDGGYKAQAQAAAEALGMPMQVVKKKRARRASRSSPGAGLSRGPLPGWATSAASPRTTSAPPKVPKPSFGSPARSSSCAASPDALSSTGSEASARRLASASGTEKPTRR